MTTNEDLLRRVESLSKEKVEKEEDHTTEMDDVIAKVKASIVVAVREAKLMLAENMENAGSCNIPGWCEALAKLTGKPVNVV